MKMRSERFQSLALAILLAIGAGVVWGVLCVWGLSIIDDTISSSDTGEQLQFLNNGTPILVSYAGRDARCRTCRTLDGKELDDASVNLAASVDLAGPEYLKATLQRAALAATGQVCHRLLGCSRDVVLRA